MWKIVCAILGYILGGFFLGLIGFIVGSVIDRAQTGGAFGNIGNRANIALQQQAFFRTLFLLMGRLAKSDGQVSEAEIQLAQTVMQRLRLSPAAQEQARQLFNEGKSANFDFVAELNHFKSVVSSGDLTRTLLEILLVSAYADGHFSVEEKSFVSQVCANLGITVAEFEALHIQVKQQAHFRQGYQSSPDGMGSKDLLKSAYEVLGVTADMNDADIKKAYRRLMSKNHPDKLSAKGLPKEMIELAKEKTQEIQSAYELVKNSRK
ncbi:molecular chaperone DnaJ [Marinomonas ushuaiensis DSM 15871]|uniref:Molecular chaperone DnaJ n=1 Tax=Marinomonas ushuaiensis DSM 15871 TaxID=1122207 RepID=X7E3M3_9GAMM|nr:co-chaperone DjlA [Marinomonas ushuaiensis]ETX10445.1 molecular chaperone DnaJ [Marinomonas ushuaiensis DSM 15871]